ncbi:MAG: stage V sporulation protein AC [Clostridia bacterium]|nr:stage V sporulation protein AC [Clostridia bacterium]
MNIDKKEYRKYAEARAQKSPILKNCLCAFLVGGAICTLGQILTEVYASLGAEKETAGTLTSLSLIFFAALLTGLGVFDNVAKFAGAGTLVPITGFANSVVAPAIDTKSEGFILGVGAKIFIISGPVILYGIFSGAVYGVIYWLVTQVL